MKSLAATAAAIDSVQATAAPRLSIDAQFPGRGRCFRRERSPILRLSAALLALVLVVAACDGAVLSSASLPGETASQAQPTATASPTEHPTATPGELEKVGQYVYAYKLSPTGAFVHYQVVAVVRNAGTSWAQQLPRHSSSTVVNASGGLTISAPFTYAFPEFIAPGDVGYLFEDALIQDGITAADFASVSTQVSSGLQAAGAGGATFTVTDIAWHTSQSGVGLTATGLVTATQDVPKAALIVFCVDADGVPLGGTFTNVLQNLTGATTKDFATDSETLPLEVRQCVATVGLAEETAP